MTTIADVMANRHVTQPEPPAEEPPPAAAASRGADYTPTAPSEAWDELLNEGEPAEAPADALPQAPETAPRPAEDPTEAPAEASPPELAAADDSPPAEPPPPDPPQDEPPPELVPTPGTFDGAIRCYRCHVLAPSTCDAATAQAAGWKVHARGEPHADVILCPACTHNHAVISAAQARHAAHPFA
jgi:hypothetical protein